MARLIVFGAEWQSSAEVQTLAGTASFVTTPIHTGGGLAALKVSPATTATGSVAIRGWGATGASANYSAANAFVSFWFRYAIKPAANDEELCDARDTGNVSKMTVRLNSSGQLAAYNSAGTLMATGTTALSQDTWYQIGVRIGTGASANWAVTIDKNAEISGTGSLGASNNGVFYLGKVVNRNGNGVEFYYDDLYADDTAFQYDTVTVPMSIEADGSTMQWINGSGGAGTGNWEEVEEIPPSSADYITSTALNDVALFDLESSASAGISGTILTVLALGQFAENSAGASGVSLRLRSNTTNVDTTARDPATGGVNGLYQDTDPDTGVAWTTGGLDAVEIGGVDTDGSPLMRMWAGVLMVNFTTVAAAAAAVAHRRALSGVGR